MKIVHIITRLIVGGAQENTILTCEGLHRRGHEVTLITGPALGPEGELMDRARRGGYPVIELPHLRRAVNPFHDIPAYRSLKKLITELDPDVVHTHSAKAGILGRRAAAKVRQSRVDACCPLVETFRKAQLACSGRPRIVHTIHGLSFHPYQNAFLNRMYIAAERKAAVHTDAFISVAQAMTEQSLAAGIGRAEQYTKVFSGLETDRFLQCPSPKQQDELRREFQLPDDTLVIATVARLFHLKGHEYIIEAAHTLTQQYKRIIWMFIGDGLLRQKYQKQVTRLGLMDNFRFCGLVPPQKVGKLLHLSDILVHCSLREGLARALPQAMLCGKPVVSFDIDGAREVVINNETGFLVPPKNIPALIKALQSLIENPALREKMGQTGRQFCRKEFDHELMVDRIEKVYKQFLGVNIESGLKSRPRA